MPNLRRKFKGTLNEKQNILYTISGVLGNDSGATNVPSRDNYVYVRLAGSGLAEVFNNRVAATYGLPVICGYDPASPSKFQVLSIQGSVAEASSFNLGTVGYAPSGRYRWMYPGGGQDPLFVESRQLMPLRITPSGGLKIKVNTQVIWNGTEWEIFGGATETDLESYLPDTEGKCCMVLVSIDDEGEIEVTVGDEVDIADLAVTDIPSPPVGTRYVLGAIRLYYGQTVIQEARTNTDVVDLRFPMFNNLSFEEILGTLSHTDLDDIGTLTHAELEEAIDDKADVSHTHVEEDITDLVHDAEKIDGITVDLTGITDGQVMVYDGTEEKLLPADQSGGGGSGGSTSSDWMDFVDGALVVETDVAGAYIVPRDCTIEAVMIHCKEPGSAGSTIVDVNKNGTTIFTTQASRPELDYDDADSVATSDTPDVTSLEAGDVLTVDIDQIGTGAESLSFIVAMTVNASSIGDLDDVDLTDIEDGDVLVWDEGESKFVAEAQSGSSDGYVLREILTYAAGDSGNFEKASYPYLKAIRVKGCGGGGAGGGRTTSGYYGMSGSGAGYCEKFITDIDGMDSEVAYSVGLGGVGVVGANGGDGEDTTFGSYITAGGGVGGLKVNTATDPVVGGTATGGDINIPGGQPSETNNSYITSAGGSFLAVVFTGVIYLTGRTRPPSGYGGGGSGTRGNASNTAGSDGGPGILILELYG